MKFITVALLALIVVYANGFARIRHPRDIDTEQWQKQIDQYVSESTTPEDLKEKISEYYSKLTEKQSDFVQFYRKQCISWIKSVASDEEKAELKALYANKDGDVLAGKINDYVNRLSENERAPVLLWKSACAYLWNIDIPTENIAAARVRRSTTSHSILSTEWLTSEQISQLSGLENDEYDKKYLQFFKDLSGETKHSASKMIVKKCYGWLEKVATQEEQDELKDLHHKDHSKCKEKVQEYLGRLPEEEKAHIKKHLDVCEEIWYAEHGHGHDHSKHHQHRRRRHHEHSFEEFAKEHLTWLSDEQKAEAMKIKDDKVALKAKMKEFFEATTGEKRQEATQSMKGACRKLMKHVLGDEKSAELKAMKESGATTEALKTKLEEFLNEITDEHLKEEANDHKEECMKVMMTPDRKKRDHHHDHKLEDYLKTHLSWLTTEQGETLKQMKADGKTPSELQKKVFEYYEATTGETREKATELLKGGCRDLIKSVVGDEKAEELKKLKESGASDSEMSDKIKSYIAEVVDPQKKELAVSYEGACKKVFGVASRKRRDHHHGHKLEDYLKTHLSWLTTEQGETLKQMKADNKSPEEMQKKVFEYYEATTGETRVKATELLQGGCRDLIKSIVGDEKAQELKNMRESGASVADLNAKVKEFMGQIEDEEKKQLASKYEGACKKIFGVQSSRKRRDHHHDDDEDLEKFAKNHLTWLTDEQKQEVVALKDSGKDAIKAKINEFYRAATGETKAKATLELQNACTELINKVIGEEHAAILKGLREAGADIGEIQKKTDEFLAQVPDERKRALAEDHREGCAQLFLTPPSRRLRRDKHHEHTLKEFIDNHASWLNAEQKAEILELDGQKEAIKTKINEFFEKTSGEEREKAVAGFQAACRERLVHVLGDQKAAELKAMRESGATNEALLAKTEELLATVEDETLKKEADEHKEDCLKVFGIKSRKIRDCGFDTEKHLTWLTDEQKDTLQQMKAEKKAPQEIHKKIFEYYDATTGETRTKAKELLQGGCRDLLIFVLGDEKAAELKAMKESGSTNDELSSKIKDFMDEIRDPKKKDYAVAYEGPCKRIFGVESRKKRDHHHGHKLEDYLKTHLSWLTTEQGETLKQMKADGKTPSELQKKVFEYYEATTGETREKATELLKGGCRDLIKSVVGDEKAEELKKLKESGASDSEMSDKIKSYIAEVVDPQKKELAVSYEGACKKVFGVASRKRRHEGKHGIDDFVNNHLSWLNAEQKTEIDKLKVEGNFAGIKSRVNTFFEAATGETKQKATEELKGACRELYQDVLGDKANEVKALKESGASDSEIAKKIDELIAGVTDEAKKAKAEEYKSDCKKIYGVQSRKKRMHDHGKEHDLEDYFKNHYSWLSEDQKNELRQLKKDGKKDEIWGKSLEFYDAATGETKEKAKELMKGGCRELIRVIIGNEKADEITAMKESGATVKEMDTKLQELIGEVADEEKKKLAATYGPGCRRIFGVGARKRRMHDHGKEHDLEDYFKTHYSWLTDEQKDELRQMKKDGKKDDIWSKSLEYYDAATGEVKEKAKELMQGGCRELIRLVIGNEKADEIKAMKESGSSVKEMDAKLQEFLGQVTEEGKKTLVGTYGPGCRKIFGIEPSRKRREHDHGEHKLEDYFKTHFSWLTDAQKDEMRQLKTDGKKAPELYAKAMEYYEAATGEVKEKAKELMQGGCRELIRVVVGNEKADELTAMKESGASIKDMDAKLQEFIGGVTDEGKKTLAGTYGPGCRKIFGVESSRKRREHDHGEHKLEDYFKTHYSWLTDEQKDELRQMKKDGKKDDIWNKSLEFYDAATGEVKQKAEELMKGGCRELIRVIIGNEKADEITAMKESGASVKDMDAKLQELIGAVTDEGKKILAKNYGPGCRRIFGVGSRKRRDHHHGHKLEDYLKTHLSWLTTEQGETLKQMKADGKTPSELQKKVFEYYEATTGETREKATELLKGGCRDLIKSVVGDEKAEELKKLKESGASDSEMSDKIKSYIAEVVDPQKKELAVSYEGACKKVFGVGARKRREHSHGEHTIEDYFKTHLSWLTDEQKDELRQMKKDGKKDDIWKKSLEFYEDATGEVKEKAKELMQGGCRELIRLVIGNEKADELTVLRESGASVKALDSKLHEFLREVTDEGKKTLAKQYGPGCRKIFGVSPEAAEKRKRRAFNPSVTHMDFIRAVVGNEDKPEPSHRTLTYQIMDIYDAEKLSERARNVVNQCHGLFGEIVKLSPYKNENSLRELLHLLRSSSNRELKGIQAVAEVCKKTVEDLEETQGNHGSIGKTLIEMFKSLDDEPQNRLRKQWKSKCLDWILDVTDAEEREDLKYLLRMGRMEVLQERVTELMARFDDKTRTQVGHMRPVCENLLGFVHNSRKTFHRKVPVETVF